MFGRVAVCAAAAVMLLAPLLTPAPSSAKGFAAGSVHHAGAFRWRFNPHARHHHHHHRHNQNGYAYWPAGFDYPQEVLTPLYDGPRCTPSVEKVIVPSESGGQREIRITRC